MTQTKPLDVVICVGVKDVFIVKKTIHYVNRNICPQHIYLLIHKKFFGFYSKEFLEAEHVTLIDEAALVPGLNITTCREMVNSHFTKGMRAGWYFQQFLKMGFALSSYAKDYYLVWDADTLPTSPLRFFDEEGRALLTQKTEYHCPYFDTMQRLIGLDKSVDFSFIAEHMVFETSIMRSLIDKIAQNGGGIWWKNIINATNPDEGLSFSEFETYGTYVHNLYRDRVAYRQLHTFRRAGYLFGRCMKQREIDEFCGVTDTLSLEAGHIPSFPRNILHYLQLGILYLLKPR